MNEPIDACATAIAGVRERFVIPSVRSLTNCLIIDTWIEKPRPHNIAFRGTRSECQAWIDREKARACLEATLPVPDGVVRAAARSIAAQDGHNPDEIFERAPLWTIYIGHGRDALTSAIHAITKQEEG